MQNNDYTIGTYYGPNEDKAVHVDTFLEKIDKIESNYLIIGGL